MTDKDLLNLAAESRIIRNAAINRYLLPAIANKHKTLIFGVTEYAMQK
jgi:hypothetical protein